MTRGRCPADDWPDRGVARGAGARPTSCAVLVADQGETDGRTSRPDDEAGSPARAVRRAGGGPARTLALLEPVAEPVLRRQHSPLMSPLVWDLAHIGNYEDQWLLRALGSRGAGRPLRRPLRRLPPPPRRPARASRCSAPTRPAAYAGRRPRPGARCCSTPSARRRGHRCSADGFVYGMVIQHEHQHDETILATLQLMDGDGLPAAPPPRPGPAARCRPSEVFVAGGPFVMGTDDEPWAYDNERPGPRGRARPVLDRRRARHQRRLPPSSWTTAATTTPRWWDADGLGVAPGSRACAPAVLAARRRDGSWVRDRFGWIEPLPPASPSSTSAGTRPTPTPAGPASACPPRPSGRRRRHGTRPPAARAATRGAIGPTGRHPRQPRPATLRAGGRRRPSPRASAPAAC